MEFSLLAPRRYIGRYPGTLPPKYPLLPEKRPESSDSRHVLIVDDDPFFRSLFKVMLRQTGWPVERIWEADDSATALGICRTQRVDMVFCDLNLPSARSRDGLEIIRDLHRMRPDVPAIMVTADNTEDLIRRVCAVGAAGHLLKPFNLRTLKRILMPYWASSNQPDSE